MKLFLLSGKDKDSVVCVLISVQHFGYVSGRGICWHGIYSSMKSLDDPSERLEKIHREHKWCIKFPWIAKYRKDLYVALH